MQNRFAVLGVSSKRFTGLVLAVSTFFLAQAAFAQVCTFRPGPDVIVGDLYGLSNYSSQGGLEALSMGTESCNLGDQELAWFANNNQHPVIAQNLYRYQDKGGWFAFEQVGMSWLKHGFTALDLSLCCLNCTDTTGNFLGIGCSDPYSGGLNGSQSSLGPRWQVNPLTGDYPYPPANPTWSGSTARRLQVEIADLEPTASTTTRYFGEGHYIAPDDATAGNQNNNASYRELSVSGSGTSWSFAFTGSTARETSAIYAWRALDPSVEIVERQFAGEGRVALAWQVTDLKDGTWHYEYALYNMNSADGVGGFSVPIPAGVSITNIDFHDVVYRDGDGENGVDRSPSDWTQALAAGALSWSTEDYSSNANANAIRWGTTYNFRFDASTPPQALDVTLTRFQSATEEVLLAQGPSPLGPAGQSFCDASDGSLASCPCANTGDPDAGCDNAQSTGGVRLGVTAFQPDGLGSGTAVFGATGFSALGTPSYVLVRSVHQTPGVAAFDGVLCLGNPVVRISAGFAVGGEASEAYVHGAMATPGAHGYQLWYRSQPAPFCTRHAANLSNGYELTW